MQHSIYAEFFDAFGASSTQKPNHIVDQLIAERTPNLSKSLFWKIARYPLHRMLHYDKAIEMADAVLPLSGAASFEHVSKILNLKVHVKGAENLPKDGAFILACNHPTGIADGIAIFDALKPYRSDCVFVANRDALRVNTRLSDKIIPVEHRADAKNHRKSRETVAGISRALEEERALVIFPSGRLAFWQKGEITERPWQSSMVSIAQKYHVPIVPVHLSGRNSFLFYLLSKLSNELRDMTVFRELLNKQNMRFDVTIGEVLQPEILNGKASDVTARLQKHVQNMGA